MFNTFSHSASVETEAQAINRLKQSSTMADRLMVKSVARLKEIARQNKLKGYSKLGKVQLIDLICKNLKELVCFNRESGHYIIFVGRHHSDRPKSISSSYETTMYLDDAKAMGYLKV